MALDDGGFYYSVKQVLLPADLIEATIAEWVGVIEGSARFWQLRKRMMKKAAALRCARPRIFLRTCSRSGRSWQRRFSGKRKRLHFRPHAQMGESEDGHRSPAVRRARSVRALGPGTAE